MATNALRPSSAAAANAELDAVLQELEATYGPAVAQNALRSFASPGLGAALRGEGDAPPAPQPGLREMLASRLVGDQTAMRDRQRRIGDMIGMPPDRPVETTPRERQVAGALGTTGIPGDKSRGFYGMGVADLLPVTHAIEAGEAIMDGNYGDAALKAGTAALGTAAIGGPAIRGVGTGLKRGYEAIKGALTASPATTGTATAATAATVGSGAAESPTTDKAEYGTPLPKPPPRPPELDAYIERALKAERDAIAARNEQQSRVAAETGRRFRPEGLDPKKETAIRERAGRDYGGISDRYTEDMRTWEAERERLIAEDRKKHFDKGFSERNPEAAAALLGASYVLPPLLTRGIWKGRYAAGDRIVKAGNEARTAGNAPALETAASRAAEWSAPRNYLARGAMTVPVAALPAETRMGMDFWDRVMLPPDSEARNRAVAATDKIAADPMGAAGSFLMQSIPGAIGAAGGFKMAGMSPRNDINELRRYLLPPSNPASPAARRVNVEANLARAPMPGGGAPPGGGSVPPGGPGGGGTPPGGGPGGGSGPTVTTGSGSSTGSTTPSPEPHWVRQPRRPNGQFGSPNDPPPRNHLRRSRDE